MTIIRQLRLVASGKEYNAVYNKEGRAALWRRYSVSDSGVKVVPDGTVFDEDSDKIWRAVDGKWICAAREIGKIRLHADQSVRGLCKILGRKPTVEEADAWKREVERQMKFELEREP